MSITSFEQMPPMTALICGRRLVRMETAMQSSNQAIKQPAGGGSSGWRRRCNQAIKQSSNLREAARQVGDGDAAEVVDASNLLLGDLDVAVGQQVVEVAVRLVVDQGDDLCHAVVRRGGQTG
eukprot:6784553-Prymnesium_polylepis.1